MPNEKILLITRPAYDEATHYLSVWGKKLIDFAEERGIKVIDLETDAKKEILENHLEKNNPRLVVFNGHGEDDLITGYAVGHILIQSGKNERILKNRIACAISCNSAKKLGPDSIKAGATAFIGFSEKFVLMHEERHSATPHRDKTAGYFLDPPNLVPTSLIKGNTVKDSFEKSQTAFEKSIDYFKTHYTPENSHILFWLTYNKKIQTICGDGGAKL